MIVWLASYPRSGNTFFRMLLYHSYGIKTFSTYNDPLLEEIGASETVGHELLPAPLEELASDEEVYFVKTHDLPIDENPAIYIVRDGRDALVSYAKFICSFNRKTGKLARMKEFLGLEGFRRTLKDLITSNRHYGGYSNNALGWTCRREKGATFVIRYEDLLNEPDLWLKKALKAFQVQIEPVGGGELPDFDTLHARWPEFFRRGKSRSWREEMPEDFHRLFWKHHAEAMEAFGYRRELGLVNDSTSLVERLAMKARTAVGAAYRVARSLGRRASLFVRSLIQYDLPVVDLRTIVGDRVCIDPPILDDICLTPYHGPRDHDDFSPLMKIAKSLQPRIVVELGTGYGNLTANICRQCPTARVYTVNALPEDHTGRITTYKLTREEIGRVYRAHGFADRVVQIYKNTLGLDLSKYFDCEAVDLAIIDACHDTDHVINDFFKVRPFVRRQGVILFHDTHPSMRGHLRGSYMACRALRRRGFNIRHIKDTWWAVWVNGDARSWFEGRSDSRHSS